MFTNHNKIVNPKFWNILFQSLNVPRQNIQKQNMDAWHNVVGFNQKHKLAT